MQDCALSAQTPTAKIIVIADGVSTCENSRMGAGIACKAAKEILLQETDYIFNADPAVFANLFLTFIYEKLAHRAAQLQQSVESFSSTLAFVCFNKMTDQVMTFSLGDSLVFASGETGFVRLSNIRNDQSDGCCVTTTTNACSYADVRVFSAAQYACYHLLTDGAWRLLYDDSGSLKTEITQLHGSGDGEILQRFFDQQTPFDDCSSISMCI